MAEGEKSDREIAEAGKGDLRKANLMGKNLEGADLSGGDLSGANLPAGKIVLFHSIFSNMPHPATRAEHRPCQCPCAHPIKNYFLLRGFPTEMQKV